jgi:hypothetical protein
MSTFVFSLGDAGANVGRDLRAQVEREAAAEGRPDDADEFLDDVALTLLSDEVLGRLGDLVAADPGTNRTMLAMALSEELAIRAGAEMGS